MAQQILRPAPEDNARIAKQVADALKLARKQSGSVEFDQTEADLVILQSIVDGHAAAPMSPYELECLGIVLGNVIAKRAGLQWMIVADEFGREPALQCPGTPGLLSPMTMISKRLAKGQPVNVASLCDQTVHKVFQSKQQAQDAKSDADNSDQASWWNKKLW